MLKHGHLVIVDPFFVNRNYTMQKILTFYVSQVGKKESERTNDTEGMRKTDRERTNDEDRR